MSRRTATVTRPRRPTAQRPAARRVAPPATRRSAAAKRPSSGTRRVAPRSGSGRARSTSPAARRRRTTKGADPLVVMVSAVGLLTLLGLAMVLSASTVFARNNEMSPWTFFVRQSMWVGAGVVAALVASRIPARMVRRLVPIIGAVALLGLVVVLLPTGLARSANGSTRWIGSESVGFQPAELAKVAVVLWVAHLMTERRAAMADWRQTIAPVGTVALVMAALLYRQPDLGSAMLIVAICGVMLVVAGARLDVMALGAMPVLAVFAYLATTGYHAERWGFLDPTGDIAGKNFQLFGSLSSLASGGWFGSGPGASKNKWGWVPEAHTDAIFAVIGEELGVVGCVAVIAAFAVFVGAGMVMARGTRDRFSMLVIVGLTGLIGIQAFVNIGVTIGALPSKGFTLPFVSYGGSSMVTMLGSVGLIASMARDRG